MSKLGDGFPPFDRMVANAAALEVPDGIGVVLLYADDNGNLRCHSRNMTWETAERLMDWAKATMQAQRAQGTAAPADAADKKAN